MANIFKRVSDIINASINDLIDRVEDPETVLKQVIKEMEENIVSAKDRLIDATASERQLQSELKSNKDRAEDWLLKAENNLKSGREEIARECLLRKKEYDDIVENLLSSWQIANDTTRRLQHQLDSLEAKLEDTKVRRSALQARKLAAQARQDMDAAKQEVQKGSKDQRFDKFEDEVNELEAKAEAMERINAELAPLEDRAKELNGDAQVEDELTALKQKLGIKE